MRALGCVRTVESLDTLGHMLNPGASFEELIHPSGGRRCGIAQADRTAAGGSKGPPIGERVTLNRKRFGVIQVASTVFFPSSLTKNPLIAEEAQVGRTVFFL